MDTLAWCTSMPIYFSLSMGCSFPSVAADEFKPTLKGVPSYALTGPLLNIGGLPATGRHSQPRLPTSAHAHADSYLAVDRRWRIESMFLNWGDLRPSSSNAS
jgi:hypothetical protein